MSDVHPDLSAVGKVDGAALLAALEAVEKLADDYQQQGYIRLLEGESVGERFAILIRAEILPTIREILAADPSEPIGAVG